MGISDRIECFITELLKEENENDWLELKRNELASFFNCVPSQINYVISTRFSPQHGFIVESRRGGGGYLRIKRIANNNPLSETIALVGNSLSFPDAEAYVSYLMRTGVLNSENAAIILNGISDNALTTAQPEKDKLRANIFKNMLSALQKG